MLLGSGLVHLLHIPESLKPPDVYRKDFIQEYLLGRAVMAGIDPYLPVATLAEKFMRDLPVPVFPHVTPHPPPVAVLSLPLGLLSYERAAWVWFVFELACLAGSIWILLRCVDRIPSAGVLILLFLISIAWAPVWTGLVVGQLMTLLLFLLVSSWFALKKTRDGVAGGLLGLALALKLMGMPLLVFLVVRKRWMAATVAIAVAGAANGAAAVLMGFERVVNYYFTTIKALFPLYRSAVHNLSAWSVGWRLFEGTGSPVDLSVRAAPLLNQPGLAPLVSTAIAIFILAVGVLWAVRAHDIDTSIGILICVTVLISPVAWSHYLVLMAIPLAVAFHKLSKRQFPGKQCFLLIGVVLLMGIPSPQLHNFQASFAENQALNPPVTVSFAVGLLGLSYSIAIVVLLGFLRYLDRGRHFAANSSHGLA
ncbi:MAG TPA: glycosyltransferase family 87 protein [Terriglobia bacterium]|nr:glycosyltransferase family 87 protein [Terriglobia bacterium]